jgi:membrane associated rhomboid family serine protease
MFNPYESREDHQPVTWLRGYPVFAAHLIVAVWVASMLGTTLCNALGQTALLGWLPFNSAAVLRGEVWRIVTYGFVNPPSLSFVVDMFMIVWFGREVERVFGRRSFLILYAGVYLVTPLIFTAVGTWLPAAWAGGAGALALFVAFAAIYPDIPTFFNLKAGWVAAILVGLYSLMALGARDGSHLIMLWATTGWALAFVRWKQGRLNLPAIRWPKISLRRKKPSLRVMPDPVRKAEPQRVAPARPRVWDQAATSEVDALLDKIAQSGIGSLTEKERARLESARAELLKKR